ncbi:hypothetical protein C8J57DRAFT_1645317 [Mycena rebaudengoi]|nr:hypothetical protein C8J57DRAFT_1645317 [Mycena rebaudengoi]
MLFSLVYVATAMVVSMIPAVGAVVGLADGCTCNGANDVNGTEYLCGDALLGPAKLPETALFAHYKQLGDLCPGAWLVRYTINGAYRFPPADGFQLSTDQLPINGTELLRPGMLVDRFGRDTGTFLAAAYTPVRQRALPPGTLNSGMYRVYKVLKDLPVVAGTTADWFEQPGQGTQYHLEKSVKDLVEAKILECIEGCSAQRN